MKWIELFESFEKNPYYECLGDELQHNVYHITNANYQKIKDLYDSTIYDESEMKKVGEYLNSRMIGEIDPDDQDKRRKKEGGYWVGYREPTLFPFQRKHNHIYIFLEKTSILL